MPDHRTEFAPSPCWVRVYFNGQPVGDSRHIMLLRESGRLPVYYFPRQDVRMEYLEPSGTTGSDPKGTGVYWHVRVDNRQAEDAAYTFRNAPQGRPALENYIAFSWDKMDAWFEEDEEVFVHARDPYTRVDVSHSSRHVRLMINEMMVAESSRPRLLFETGLPTRYYIPRQDTRMDLLEGSATMTRCPYKGEAHYYSVRIGDKVYKDLVWCYRYPVPECGKIQDLVCFFNEKVDLYEDGILLPRPKSPWS
ncbi:MAG: DUF427 domain-containing protein [Acidiferrobacterales bacterium]|nr:DUF427 domain-containing protein [Acidiferrobacterales bacterium]